MWAHLALGIALLSSAAGLDNGLGRTPAMGYNTWNDFRCDGISAERIRNVADAFIKYGLDKAGYRYVNIDDCWAASRDPKTGVVIPDPKSFPDGMKAVADYIHSKGLKFGIYTCRGNKTCAGRPGSEGYERVDADTYASWEVDYLKEDSCFAPSDHPSAFEQYGRMRDALNATGRPIYFSLCGWGGWYAPKGAALGNSWRIGGDVNNWNGAVVAASINSKLAPYAGPGAWNDPDMLVGSAPGAAVHMTPAQSRTQFSLWSVMSAPLLIGSNILNISAFDLETYSNMEVIAVDQDPLGLQGTIMWENCPERSLDILLLEARAGNWPAPPECQQVWGKKLHGGAYAVALVNYASQAAELEVNATLMQKMGFEHGAHIRDLWAKEDLGVQNDSFRATVAGNGASVLFRLTAPAQRVFL